MSSHLSASLYVGDLPSDVSETQLFEIFNTVGPVLSIRVCRDAITRRSLGYAYVNFHNVVDAERALDTLNNTPIKDKPCRIMWVQRDPTIRKTGVGNIFIKNLDPSIGHKELFDTFSIFGNILSCKVALDENAKSKGYGFVHFESAEAADAAIKMVHNKNLRTTTVFVGRFVPKKEFLKAKESSWTNVYVKEIDPSISSEDLRNKFAELVCSGDPSSITSCIIMKDNNGTSRGFGFVNFSKHELAMKAVDELNGLKLGQKNLWCGRAQKKAERKQELKKKYEQLKMQRMSKYQGINLYLKNLEDDMTEERLRSEFSTFGEIQSCKIAVDDKGNSRGFGFICFTTPEEAQKAINEMNTRVMQGCQKPLYVALHEPAEIRKQKLAQRNIGKNVVYGSQPVYYNPNSGYGYPQQMPPRNPRWQQSQMQYPNYMVPQSGSHRGRGRGNRRNNPGIPPPQVQMQDPSILHASAPLTLQQLLSFPPEQQKMMLGEKLYPLVNLVNPQLSGKITGMFLDSGWPTQELYAMIHDEKLLSDKIAQAVTVLNESQDVQEQDQNQQ